MNNKEIFRLRIATFHAIYETPDDLGAAALRSLGIPQRRAEQLQQEFDIVYKHNVFPGEVTTFSKEDIERLIREWKLSKEDKQLFKKNAALFFEEFIEYFSGHRKNDLFEAGRLYLSNGDTDTETLVDWIAANPIEAIEAYEHIIGDINDLQIRKLIDRFHEQATYGYLDKVDF